MKPKEPSSPPPPDPERIDEAVLALLWLTASTERAGTEFAVTTAWKGHDWAALGRLHEKGFIGNPVGKQKSIVFTEEGCERAKALFEQMFCGSERTFSAVPASARPRELTQEQLNGCACVVCGSNQRPMVPLGLETSLSPEVFRCDREECAVDPGEVQRWIDISDKP
jgi:Domain of unknown function (DUF6429)